MNSHICILFLAVFGISVTRANVSITFPQASDVENSVTDFSNEKGSSNGYLKEVANRVATLGFHTLRDLLSGHSNVIISPFNVYACLGILNLGAAGVTKDEIRRVLGSADGNHTVREMVNSNDGVSYASALFLDDGFEPKSEFVAAAATKFRASVLHVNVSDGAQAKESINSWVSNHTNKTIENLLQGSLDPATKMVIVSALLFKGKWLHAFPSVATASGKFETDNSSVDIPFMHLFAAVPFARNPEFDAISLPYIDAQGMTMHVILPKARGTQALKALLSHLNPDSLKNLRRESIKEETFIALPKITVEGRFSLSDSLKKQGIATMFNPSRANFTALSENSSGLFVSQVYHSIHFEMNEEGTVASAATTAILTKSSRHTFRANRPFVFVITDKADFILFLGLILNPSP